MPGRMAGACGRVLSSASGAFLECLESYLKESFTVEMFEFIMCWFYMEV